MITDEKKSRVEEGSEEKISLLPACRQAGLLACPVRSFTGLLATLVEGVMNEKKGKHYLKCKDGFTPLEKIFTFLSRVKKYIAKSFSFRGNISNRLSFQTGFTLIELMVVMLILSLIAAFALPKYFGKVDKAKQQAAFTQIELFGTALDSYRLDVGQYPTTSEGLEALITKPSGAESWDGPYLKKMEIPPDPWNHPYHYESPGSHGDYDLYSYGKDNVAGGDGTNQDIVSWKGLR